MFVLRSAAIVLLLITVVAGPVAGGGGTPPPLPLPPGGGGVPPPALPPPPAPLTINDLKAVSTLGNIYTFTGQMTGGDGSAVTINFGDAPTMVGKTCTVQEDGSFTFTIELMEDDYGTVSAQAVDTSGEVSAMDYVFVLID